METPNKLTESNLGSRYTYKYRRQLNDLGTYSSRFMQFILSTFPAKKELQVGKRASKLTRGSDLCERSILWKLVKYSVGSPIGEK